MNVFLIYLNCIGPAVAFDRGKRSEEDITSANVPDWLTNLSRECPGSHPWVFDKGKFCCHHSKEKIDTKGDIGLNFNTY